MACFNLSLSCIQVLSMPTIYRTSCSLVEHTCPSTIQPQLISQSAAWNGMALNFPCSWNLTCSLTSHGFARGISSFLNAQPCLSISCMSSCYGVSFLIQFPWLVFQMCSKGVCPDIYTTVTVLRDNVYLLEVISLL